MFNNGYSASETFSKLEKCRSFFKIFKFLYITYYICHFLTVVFDDDSLFSSLQQSNNRSISSFFALLWVICGTALGCILTGKVS